MKKKRVLFCILMCACLTMAACGKSDSEEGQASQTKYERAIAVNNGTLSDDSVAISVGKTAVTYAEYKAYDYFMKNQFESVLGQDVWKYKLDGDGKTVGQDAVEDVLRLIIQVKVIKKTADAQGITLAADEKEAADNSAMKYCETLSDNVKKAYGINTAMLGTIFEENKLAEKMYNIIVGKADVKLTDNQCQAARVQLIYLGAGADKETVRKTAEGLRTKALKAGSFYTFAREHTQMDEVECLIGRQDTRERLATACLALKRGAISEVIEEADGFYIACCIETDSKALRKEYKNQVVEKRQNEAFTDAYRMWAKGYEVKASKSLLVK